MGSIYSPVFDFKSSYMLASPNLINGEISRLFVAYMESGLVWAREEMVSLFQLHAYKFGLVYDNTKFRALEKIRKGQNNYQFQ